MSSLITIKYERPQIDYTLLWIDYPLPKHYTIDEYGNLIELISNTGEHLGRAI